MVYATDVQQPRLDKQGGGFRISEDEEGRDRRSGDGLKSSCEHEAEIQRLDQN